MFQLWLSPKAFLTTLESQSCATVFSFIYICDFKFTSELSWESPFYPLALWATALPGHQFSQVVNELNSSLNPYTIFLSLITINLFQTNWAIDSYWHISNIFYGSPFTLFILHFQWEKNLRRLIKMMIQEKSKKKTNGNDSDILINIY